MNKVGISVETARLGAKRDSMVDPLHLTCSVLI